jgi:hypothetical protein
MMGDTQSAQRFAALVLVQGITLSQEAVAIFPASRSASQDAAEQQRVQQKRQGRLDRVSKPFQLQKERYGDGMARRRRNRQP